jgi:hypothetical protein
MALPSEAVARYLQILQSDRYRDLAWVAELQDGTRERELAEAGRLLRPHFLPKSQFAMLARATERLSAIVEQVYTLALQSGPLLRRLRLLPAERALAELPPGPIRMNVAAHAEAYVHDGNFVLSGFQSAIAPGLACIDQLTEAFSKLPILRDFQLSGFPLSPVCSGGHLSQMVLKTWKEFGGKCIPRIGVLQCSDLLSAEEEGLPDLLSRGTGNACFVRPESLRFAGGRLRSGDVVIDVLFRHLPTRELLLHLDLEHPLFQACREGAVCVVNSFRSDIVNRRSFFALLTDCTVVSRLPACDRKLVYELAPWTRVVAPGKTDFHGTEIGLLEFIVKNREQLVLLPSDPAAGLQSFTGAQMTASDWDRAVRSALQSLYVVQQRPRIDCEIFPTYRYGNLEMPPAEVTVHPHIFGGKVHGASTVLARTCLGSTRPLALAPVFLLDSE